MNDDQKAFSEAALEALERIADALERAYPPVTTEDGPPQGPTGPS